MLDSADQASAPAVAVVTLPAEVDITNVADVDQEVASAFDRGASVVVADMTATTFCDSSGVQMLARARSRAVRDGTQLRLVVVSDRVLRIMALMGFDRLVPIFPSLAEAMATAAAVSGQGSSTTE